MAVFPNHYPLLALYAIASFVLAFPDTAYTGLLKNELKMTPADVSRFYATIFVPWALKPVYAYILLSLSKRAQAALFCCACLGSSCAYGVTAAFAETSVAALSFTTIRSVCNAAVETFLSVLLVWHLQDGRFSGSAAKAQSSANAARYAGSLLAFLSGLPVYGCGTARAVLPRRIIGSTAIFPIAGAICAVAGGVFELRKYKRRKSDQNSRAGASLAILSAAVLAQAAFIAPSLLPWMGLKSNSKAVAASAVGVLVVIIAVILVFGGRVNAGGKKTLLLPSALCFFLSASPTVTTPWSYFVFSASTSEESMCMPQILTSVSSLASISACFAFARIGGKRLHVLFAVAASCAASLIMMPAPSAHSSAYLVSVEILNAFFSEFALLAVQVFIVQRSVSSSSAAKENNDELVEYPPGVEAGNVPLLLREDAAPSSLPAVKESENEIGSGKPSAALSYVIMLSLLDLGNSVSEWIAAPIESALGISNDHYDGLSTMVWICAAVKLTVAATAFAAASRLERWRK